MQKRLIQVTMPTITLGCYCDDGSIESVSLTWFLLHVLEALGYVAMEPIYLGRQSTWPSVPCQRGAQACVECRPDTDSEARRGLKAMLLGG